MSEYALFAVLVGLIVLWLAGNQLGDSAASQH